MLHTNGDVDLLQMTIDNDIQAAYQRKDTENPNYIDVLTGKARRVYDTPDKGILWGWEVSAYVFTKAIAAGAFLIPFLAIILGYEVSSTAKLWSAGISLVVGFNRFVLGDGFRQTRQILKCFITSTMEFLVGKGRIYHFNFWFVSNRLGSNDILRH